MLQLLISILGILITIIFVIGTHEFAHFIVARMVGVKVLRFSIGFGKALFRRSDKSGTEYVFALIPLGGYVKMLDESEETVPANELHQAYNRQPFYKKCMIVLAGPLMNILCALVLYWIIFMMGISTLKPIIGKVEPQSIASAAALKPDQLITHIDNEQINSWMGIVFRLLSHAGDNDHVTLTVSNLKPPFQSEVHTLNLMNWHMDKLKPDPLSSLGITPYEPNIPLVINVIKPDSPAAASGLRTGDKLLAMNQQPIKDWMDIYTTVGAQPEQTIVFSVLRHGKKINVPVQVGYERSWWGTKHGYLGIGPNFRWPDELIRKIQYSPAPAFARAAKQISDFTYFNFMLIGKLLTGKLSLQTLGGPITIFESAGDALNQGILSFLAFLAFLSISIGVINLLPIPGLDGGHLFIQLIEFIIRRPVPERLLNISFRFGFGLLIFVLVQALVNDILRMY